MKSFKEFILETPFLDTSLKKENFKVSGEKLSDDLNNLHNKSEKVSDTDIGSIHRLDYRGLRGYYHYVNGKPREISLITKSNIQRYTNKNAGNSKYIKKIMKHHTKKFGELKSDDEQSIGGMKLWKSLYNEKDPDFTFHHYNNLRIDDGKEHYDKHKIDDEYLKNNEHTIWNKNKEQGKKHRIGMGSNV